MNHRIKTAVILAAGTGIRIRVFFDKPKGFIEINNKSIIELSIEKLIACGVNRIVIVTGYNHVFYAHLANKFSEIELVYNDKYDCSNHLYSLYCTREVITEDILLLESDIIYEQRALEEILSSREPNVILVSDISGSKDEVFVETKENHLFNMSKNSNDLDTIFGEFVGISLLSHSFIAKVFSIVESNIGTSMLEAYDTYGINIAAQSLPVHCYKIADLAWSEIDTYDMYLRAVEIFNKTNYNELERNLGF